MKDDESAIKHSKDSRYSQQKSSHFRDYRDRERKRVEEHRYRDNHFSRPSRHQQYEERKDVQPKPVNGMCNPMCPLFRCTKKALMVKLINGKPTAFCTWVNDTCISYKCQYSSCSQRYLLPDGKCLAATKSDTQKEDMFLKELERSEDNKNLKNLLSRKGFGKDLVF
ncbi:MAG: hypothetical protein QW111_03045 [Ignisphaera sp.]